MHLRGYESTRVVQSKSLLTWHDLRHSAIKVLATLKFTYLIPAHKLRFYFDQFFKIMVRMENAKDVMLGILGASGTFAALLLVYSGFIFAQAASFPSTTADKLLRKYTKAGRLALLPFWGFLVAGIMATVWLIYPQHCVYAVCVVVFLVSIVGTGVYGTLASFKYL